MIPMSDTRQESFNIWTQDEKVCGPLDVDTLVQWIKEARVSPETFLQRQSDARWRRAADFDLLQENFRGADQSPGPRAGNGSPSAAVTLRELKVFHDLSHEGLEQIAALGQFQDAAPEDVIVRQGDPGDAVYFVLSGELRVRLIIGVVDRMDKTLCKLTSGEFFGEMGMFLQSKRTADVIAQKPSRLFRMSTNAFELLVRQIPNLAAPVLFNIGVTMARRIVEDNQRLDREVTSKFLWS
jgi:CRP-like cAMP-binding protein